MLQEILEELKAQVNPFRLTRIRVAKDLAANANAHAAGDVLSETDTAGAGTPWVFKNAAKVSGGSGYIVQADVNIEPELQTHRIALQVYTKYPTCELDDNAAVNSPNPVDASSFVGEILLPALGSRGANSFAVATPSTTGNLPLAFKCATGSRDLYIVAIAVDATTHTATEEMAVTLLIEPHI